MYRIRIVGTAAQVASTATALADADGVELTSSDVPLILGENSVDLGVAVEGAVDSIAVGCRRARRSRSSAAEERGLSALRVR